jgi:hypothetical protein
VVSTETDTIVKTVAATLRVAAGLDTDHQPALPEEDA